MITVHFVSSGGTGTALQCRTGQSLMQAAVAADVAGIAADCGGMMTCGTCHVFVREPYAGRLPPVFAEEHAMLEFTAVPRQANSRLSCQIDLTDALDGLTVDLPDTQY
ncbi:MAG: ferredoxin [Ramlibacter sp.]|nr:ferredoxin [Ramlibacter sp.]